MSLVGTREDQILEAHGVTFPPFSEWTDAHKFVAILTSDVVSAERMIDDYVKRVNNIASNVQRDVANPLGSVQSLGALQNTGTGFDAYVTTLAERRRTLGLAIQMLIAGK